MNHSKDFEIAVLKKLFEEDYETQNFRKMKSDDIYDIIEHKPLKSKQYLETRLIKFMSDEFG